MGSPVLVMGDRLTGLCTIHTIPNPTSGLPQPAPPLPFSAPLTVGLSTTVLIHGKSAAVQGAFGMNSPPHIGLHASDPFMTPVMQKGTVMSGSPSVLVEGKPAATGQSTCTGCGGSAQAMPTTMDVLIG